MKNVSVWSRSRLELPFFAWSRGADPIWLEPELESAPGPRTSGAGADQKSGSSATLVLTFCSNTSYPFHVQFSFIYTRLYAHLLKNWH